MLGPHDYYQNEEECNMEDFGPQPFVADIEKVTLCNPNFRTALWTGEHLQVTLMHIPVGGEIGLEIHPHLDQFLRIEKGMGLVKMGQSMQSLDYQKEVLEGYAVLIPASTWHNLINTGSEPIKLYSIYAPPQHPHGTVHKTKAEADAAENH